MSQDIPWIPSSHEASRHEASSHGALRIDQSWSADDKETENIYARNIGASHWHIGGETRKPPEAGAGDG